MTEVYMACPIDGFELCQPANGDDFETLNVLLDGVPRSKGWKGPRMILVRKDEGRALRRSDFPWLGEHALIFRDEAIDSALRALMLSCGELLPLDCADSGLVLFNPTTVVNALDEERSVVDRLQSGRIWQIRRHVFYPERIGSLDAFKIPSLRVSPTFVSDRFVRAVTAAGVRGVEFEKLWP